jgi:hypothetical protein
MLRHDSPPEKGHDIGEARTSGHGRSERQGSIRDDSKITLTLPRSVLRQLRARTVTEETTIRALMLQALADSGYMIDADEICDKRSTRGRRKADSCPEPSKRVSRNPQPSEKIAGVMHHPAADSGRS